MLSEYRLVYYGACYCCCFILLHISLSIKLFFSSFFSPGIFFCMYDEEFGCCMACREEKLLSDAMPARKMYVLSSYSESTHKKREIFSPFHSFEYFDIHFLCAQFSPQCYSREQTNARIYWSGRTFYFL